jgi:hypothetical protein
MVYVIEIRQTIEPCQVVNDHPWQSHTAFITRLGLFVVVSSFGFAK